MLTIDYLRAATLWRPAAASGCQIAKIERERPPRVVHEGALESIRKLCHYPNDGYLPLTFPFIDALPIHLKNMLDRRFPLPIIGTVHIRSQALQIRPIGAGEAIRPVCWIEGARDCEKGLEFDLKTNILVGQELVWQGCATLLRRRNRKRRSSLPSLHAMPDMHESEDEVWDLPADLSRQFALKSGDLNPIHLSALAARLFGFSGAIAHGSWAELRLIGTQAELIHRPNLAWQCEFKQPIVLPTKVIFRQRSQQSPSGKVELGLFDHLTSKTHVIGQLGPKEP